MTQGQYPTAFEYGFDGLKALEALIRSSPYKTLMQAIASLALFSDPETVRQTANRGVIPVIRHTTTRYPSSSRGDIIEINGQRIGLDDNTTPTYVFRWCNGIKPRPSEVQFTHVYADSQNPESYTCLANICMTPSFLAKLTDTHPDILAILKYRVWELYEWHPLGALEPDKPSGYADLIWAPCLPPVNDVRVRFNEYASKNSKNRCAIFARKIGSIFQ